MVKLVTGDETGLIKYCDVKARQILSKFGDQGPRENGIIATTWIPNVGNDTKANATYFASLTASGLLTVMDPVTGEVRHKIRNVTVNSKLLDYFRGRFITCSSDGTVKVFDASANDLDVDLTKVSTFDIGKNVGCAKFHHSGILAVGGNERDLTLYDIKDECKEIWKARNVKNNFLDMRVPVWVRDIVFLRSLEDGENKEPTPYLLAIVSAHKHIRIYDTREENHRPVKEIVLGDRPFTAVAQSTDGKYLFTGDNIGTIRRINLSDMKLSGHYRGPTGGVKAISVHPSLPLLAVACMDRNCWIYDINTRQQMRKLYMKQRLNTCMFGAGINDSAFEGDGPLPGMGRTLVHKDLLIQIREEREKEEAAAAALAAEAEADWEELEQRSRKARKIEEGEEDGDIDDFVGSDFEDDENEMDEEFEGDEVEGSDEDFDDDDDDEEDDFDDDDDDDDGDDSDDDALFTSVKAGKRLLREDESEKKAALKKSNSSTTKKGQHLHGGKKQKR